ncbi:MAG: ABC-type Mn2+/Zn2+ transport system permease subunit [Rubritalea sp.]|jgi:ABC-type Mn2+/Zn2+ transport system permease subunit/Mn-dependent DtxR family transcriptional regulator
MNRSRHSLAIIQLLVITLILAGTAHAARISEITETSIGEQALRFFTFQDRSLRYALLGSLLLGISCGLMGVFLVVKRLSLMSDALSHAVLPGIAFGYLWNMTRDPIAIFIGATICGLLGSGVVQTIRNTTKQKEDAALGFVLSAFFAVGVCLLTMIQNLPGGNKSGLDQFMFGQIAAIGKTDLYLLGGVTFLVVALVVIFYKELRATSFDSAFSRSVGIPSSFFHYLLMLLLAFAIVSALQAVGVVLVSAMLVIPAAAAFLLTDRFATMLVISAVFGMTTGSIGSFLSFVGRDLPTGPLMVLTAGTFFATALFFGPKHGIVARWWGRRSRALIVRRENALKSLYRVMENDDFQRDFIIVEEIATQRSETIEEVSKSARTLQKAKLIKISHDKKNLTFTATGWRRACEIVRNHRLWELYLTRAADFAVDHVHDGAEEIEHVLGEDIIRKIESELNHAKLDPHGKAIPGWEDISAPYTTPSSPTAS